MLDFRGIQKTTLIDFPGKVACTLFLPKCNFRCPFCYNRQLVFDEVTGVSISEAQALGFLEERKNFLDGVCITGGEPLLHGLKPFLEKARGKGLLVKLDTNGSRPRALKGLLDARLLDFVSMDVKASRHGYEKAAGVKVDLQAVDKSISLLKASGIGHEFRTTVVPGFHSKESLLELGKWLKGAKSFVLQQFNSTVPLLDPTLEGKKPFSEKELGAFAKELEPFFQEVKVRGL